MILLLKMSPEHLGKKTHVIWNHQMNLRLLHVLQISTGSIRVANSFG